MEKKKKQKFTTLDRLVMKIFRERSRTSRRGTCSFSSITAAALQNAQRVPAFSSSLFQLSLLLSLFRLLSQNPFLPASSICLGPRFYFYTRRCYHPPTRYSFHFPLPPLRNFPIHPPPPLPAPSYPSRFPSLSRRLSPPYPTLSALLLLFAIPYAIPSPSPSLCSWPFLFKRRWLQLAYFTRPASKRMLIFIHLSVYVVFVCSPTQPLALLVAPPRFCPSRFTPPPRPVSWLTFKFYSPVEN